jgi:anti-anti-sigma regulatory factor
MATGTSETNPQTERSTFSLRMAATPSERAIFFLRGDLLGPSCSAFADFTGTCIDAGTRRLRLDLTELRSLDLDGVNSLLAVHQRLSTVGGRLLLTNVSPEVVSVLRLFARPLLTAGTSMLFGLPGHRPVEPSPVSRLAG